MRILCRDMNSSLKFAGNPQNGYILPADTSILRIGDSSNYTIGAWMNLNRKISSGNADNHTLAACGFDYAGNLGTLFQCAASGGYLVFFSGWDYYDSWISVFPYGEWFHLAFVVVGSTLIAYVNGILVWTQAIARKDDSVGGANYIGREWISWRVIDGLMCDFFAVKSALSISQIQDVCFRGVYPSLGVHYSLDEGAGSTATDSSGNGNNGVITNATWSTDTPIKLRSAATRTIPQTRTIQANRITLA